MEAMRFELIRDRQGMIWDLLMYVPMVVGLLALAAKFWFEENYWVTNFLLFAGCYMVFVGGNRILKERLMVLPSAPVAIAVGKDGVAVDLRNGKHMEIVKELRYYSEMNGKTFALSGMGTSGQRLQFVFHKGQFADDKSFQAAQKALRDR